MILKISRLPVNPVRSPWTTPPIIPCTRSSCLIFAHTCLPSHPLPGNYLVLPLSLFVMGYCLSCNCVCISAFLLWSNEIPLGSYHFVVSPLNYHKLWQFQGKKIVKHRWKYPQYCLKSVLGCDFKKLDDKMSAVKCMICANSTLKML